MRLGIFSCLGRENRDQQTNVEQGRGAMRLEDERVMIKETQMWGVRVFISLVGYLN